MAFENIQNQITHQIKTAFQVYQANKGPIRKTIGFWANLFSIQASDENSPYINALIFFQEKQNRQRSILEQKAFLSSKERFELKYNDEIYLIKFILFQQQWLSKLIQAQTLSATICKDLSQFLKGHYHPSFISFIEGESACFSHLNETYLPHYLIDKITYFIQLLRLLREITEGNAQDDLYKSIELLAPLFTIEIIINPAKDCAPYDVSYLEKFNSYADIPLDARSRFIHFIDAFRATLHEPHRRNKFNITTPELILKIFEATQNFDLFTRENFARLKRLSSDNCEGIFLVIDLITFHRFHHIINQAFFERLLSHSEKVIPLYKQMSNLRILDLHSPERQHCAKLFEACDEMIFDAVQLLINKSNTESVFKLMYLAKMIDTVCLLDSFEESIRAEKHAKSINKTKTFAALIFQLEAENKLDVKNYESLIEPENARSISIIAYR